VLGSFASGAEETQVFGVMGG